MKKNIGKTDKMVRLGVAAVLALLVVAGVVEGTLAGVFIVAALVAAGTAFIHFCPLYTVLGISTCKAGGACCGGKPDCANKDKEQA